MLKRSFLILTALLLCLSMTSCMKKPVKPNSVNAPDQAIAETGVERASSPDVSPSSEGINLLTSAKSLVNGIFSAFGKSGKITKGFSISKSQVVTVAVIGGVVLMGLLVLFQNRPKKYSAPKGKYQA
jgi:hypothetical protein